MLTFLCTVWGSVVILWSCWLCFWSCFGNRLLLAISCDSRAPGTQLQSNKATAAAASFSAEAICSTFCCFISEQPQQQLKTDKLKFSFGRVSGPYQNLVWRGFVHRSALWKADKKEGPYSEKEQQGQMEGVLRTVDVVVSVSGSDVSTWAACPSWYSWVEH